MNRSKSLLYKVRGCLITTFCSLYFDGRNADILYREWHINDFLMTLMMFYTFKMLRFGELKLVVSLHGQLHYLRFRNRSIFLNLCLTFALLTLPDLGNSSTANPTLPFINLETMKKYDCKLLNVFTHARVWIMPSKTLQNLNLWNLKFLEHTFIV